MVTVSNVLLHTHAVLGDPHQSEVVVISAEEFKQLQVYTQICCVVDVQFARLSVDGKVILLSAFL